MCVKFTQATMQTVRWTTTALRPINTVNTLQVIKLDFTQETHFILDIWK
jgi:hypothetical protein